MGEPWLCAGCGAPSKKTERTCSCATACLFKAGEKGRALKDDAFADEADTAFLEGVKAGIAEVRRVLDQCNDPCPTCHENLEAIDPATITRKGGAEKRA